MNCEMNGPGVAKQPKTEATHRRPSRYPIPLSPFRYLALKLRCINGSKNNVKAASALAAVRQVKPVHPTLPYPCRSSPPGPTLMQ